MAKKKSLPNTLYVYRDKDPSDAETTWFTSYEDLQDCAEMGEERLVGVYDLRNTVKVSTKIVTKPA